MPTIDDRLRTLVDEHVVPPPIEELTAFVRRRVRRARRRTLAAVGCVLAIVVTGVVVTREGGDDRTRIETVVPPVPEPTRFQPTWRGSGTGETRDVEFTSRARGDRGLLYVTTTFDRQLVNQASVAAFYADNGTIAWRHRVPRAPRLAAAAEDLLLVAPQDDVLIALDAGTGAERWRFMHASKGACYGFGRPTEDDGVVYALSSESCDSAHRPSVAFAIDADTGDELWRTTLTGTLEQPESTPIVAGGTVVFMAFGGGNAVGWSDVFVGLDATTGEVRWRHDFPMPAVPGVGAAPLFTARAPVVTGDLVILPPISGELVGVDAITGERRWSTPPETGRSSAPPVISDGILYTPAVDGVLALDAATGAERWRVPRFGEVSIEPAGELLLIAGEDTGVAAVDAATGTERWTVSTLERGRADSTRAVSAGNRVVVVETASEGSGQLDLEAFLPNGTTTLRLLDRASGRELHRVTLEQLTFEVVIQHDHVYAVANDGTVAAYRLVP